MLLRAVLSQLPSCHSRGRPDMNFCPDWPLKRRQLHPLWPVQCDVARPQSVLIHIGRAHHALARQVEHTAWRSPRKEVREFVDPHIREVCCFHPSSEDPGSLNVNVPGPARGAAGPSACRCTASAIRLISLAFPTPHQTLKAKRPPGRRTR